MGPIPVATQNKIIGTLRNQFGTAEGSQLPPPQVGANRVPIVTGLVVQNTISFVGGTQFTLQFNAPTGINNIDHYNIYVSGLTGNPSDFQGPSSATTSPATVRVNTLNAQKVTFFVQTVLSNGLQSILSTSPSCTGTTISGTINTNDIPNGSITLAQLAAETPGALITFASSTGTPTLINPVAVGSVLASNGTTGPPTYQAPSSLNIVTAQATRVTSTFTKTSSAVLSNITGLTATLVAGNSYYFEATLWVAANSAGGTQFSIAGTATATAVIYSLIMMDESTNVPTLIARETALGNGDGQTGTTSGTVKIYGTITCNAGGTLTVQFAQNASNAAASTVAVGSTFVVSNIA